VKDVEATDYLTSSGLSSAITNVLSSLAALELLPDNPYSFVVPLLRLEEVRATLFDGPNVETAWLQQLIGGEGYGVTNTINKKRANRAAAELGPVSKIVCVPLGDLRVSTLSPTGTSHDATNCKFSSTTQTTLHNTKRRAIRRDMHVMHALKCFCVALRVRC